MRRLVVALGCVSMLGAACGGAAASGGPSTGANSATDAAARADLAPTGKLRLGFPANPPFFGQRDPASGVWKGLAITAGTALAKSLGVPLVPTEYADPGQTYQALHQGAVDVVVAPLQSKPDWAAGAEALVRVEHTYLVRSTSTLQSAADVDRQGIRVGSVAGSPHTAFLASQLARAQLVQFGSDAVGLAALAAGQIDAFADARAALAEAMSQVPGSRLLSGAFFTPGFGFVTLSSHAKGAAFLDSFAASAFSSGRLQNWIEALSKPGLLAGPG